MNMFHSVPGVPRGKWNALAVGRGAFVICNVTARNKLPIIETGIRLF